MQRVDEPKHFAGQLAMELAGPGSPKLLFFSLKDPAPWHRLLGSSSSLVYLKLASSVASKDPAGMLE